MSSSASRARRMWTKEEDDTLRRISEAQAQTHNGSVKDWCAIAKMLPGRTNKDCRKRFSKVTKSVNKGTWSPAEDERLMKAMQNFGPSWQHIAEKVGTRHAEQCAKRWQHSLDPAIDRSEWTEQDDQLLLDAVRILGRSWRNVAKTYFPQRSTTDIKNHFEYVNRRLRGSVDSAQSQREATAVGQAREERSSHSPCDVRDGSSARPVSSSRDHPSVHARTEHILTGCALAPDTFAEFGNQSPTGRTAMGFGAEDMMMLSQPRQYDQFLDAQSPFEYTMHTYSTSTAPRHADSVSTATSNSSSHASGTTDYHYPPISTMDNFMTGPLESAHGSSYYNYTTSPDGQTLSPSPLPRLQYPPLRQGSRSPGGSRYTLVLDELPPENVSMVLEPLARSGVNVSMKLYNRE